jgi:hypothetical protein
MSESLKMLETEEGQNNAVFACFGSAAQHAQMFEEALGNFLLAYTHIRPKKLTAEELEELTQNTHGRTMGQLLRELKSVVKFNDGDDPKERMEAALYVRNYLMHRWFLGCVRVSVISLLVWVVRNRCPRRTTSAPASLARRSPR